MPETIIDSRPYSRLPSLRLELVDDGQRFLLRFNNGGVVADSVIDDWPYYANRRSRATAELLARDGLELYSR